MFDDTSSPKAKYNNSDVQNEAAKITAQIGNDSQEIVIIFTPHGTINTDLGTDCAAHFSSQGLNWFTMVHNYTFITMPYNPDIANCGAGIISNVLDGTSIVLGHEIAETITDPYANNGLNIGAWAGWISDPVTQGGQEIGDLCAWQDLQDTPVPPQLVATQPLWSNQDHNCIQMTTAIQTNSNNFVTRR